MTALAFSGVIFDLDGTLIDSVPDVTSAVNRALAEFGRRPVAVEEVRAMVGAGPVPLVRAALAAAGAPPSDSEVTAAVERYLIHYRREPAARTLVFEGAGEVLKEFAAADVRLGICTNKPHDMTLLVLSTLGIGPLFSAVAGGNRLPYRKPDGRHLRYVREEMGCTRLPVVFVGDSEIDMAAARDAGIPVVAVTFGYARGPAARLDADGFIDSFAELPSALRTLALATASPLA